MDQQLIKPVEPSLGHLPRRRFLTGAIAAVTAWQATRGHLRAADDDGRPPVKNARATSGDVASEPNWDERLSISVGPRDATIVGNDDKALQAAVDYVARLGGGTVKVLPGTYRLRNAVHLTSNIRLVGSGADTILWKEPSVRTKLVLDSDWYDQEITVEDGSAFRVGDGVCLQATNPHTNSPLYIKRTLVARSGNRFKLDRALRENLWLMGKSTAVSSFPILTAENAAGIVIENIALDGNKDKNELLDGNHAGCVFMQDCRDVRMERVVARNYNGDGLSWQICHNVRVTDCHSHDHTGLGLHPGSGSQRPLMRGNRLENNQIGLFFCWGVRYGLAENNTIRGNRGSGISIGHRDTDNIVRNNEVVDSGQVGILFRPERGEGFSGDRNLIEGNRVVNSGNDEGVAIDVQGYTAACRLVRNVLDEKRGPARRAAVRLGEHVGKMELADNQMAGFSKDVVDLRKQA